MTDTPNKPLLTVKQQDTLKIMLGLFKDSQEKEMQVLTDIGNRIINNEPVKKDEVSFVKLLISKYQLKTKQDKNQRKINNILQAEKQAQRRLYDRQKYIFGGIIIPLLKELAKNNANNLFVLEFLEDIFKANLKDSDIPITQPIFDEIDKIRQANPSLNEVHLVCIGRKPQQEPPQEPPPDYEY